MSLYIVEFKQIAVEVFNLRTVDFKFFSFERIVVISVDFDYKFVLGLMVVSPHLLQRCKATDGYCLREKWFLGAFSLLGCHYAHAHLQRGELCLFVKLH